jgi:hypothetical protein
MESTSFYITLQNNVSKENFFHNNTASEFKVRLPRTLYLRGKYEVALVEIQYPHTWQTFNSNGDYMFACYDPGGSPHLIFFPKGYYNNVNELVAELNTSFISYMRRINRECEEEYDMAAPAYMREAYSEENNQDACYNVGFSYSNVDNRVKLYVKGGWSVRFYAALAQVLGFDYGRNYATTTNAPYRANIKRGFNTLYVYCSICEPQIIGDTFAPLLRTVFITENRGKTVDTIFDSPHYIPVMQSKFDVIEVNIKNDLNELVSFGENAKVLCKLHFRQKAL